MIQFGVKKLTLVILICGLAISVLTGCELDDSAVEYVIPVVNRCNDPFSFDDYFRKPKRVNVNLDDEFPVAGTISDVVFTGRYAFLLDGNRRLSKIDLRKRRVVEQRQFKRSQVVLSYYDKHLYVLGLDSNCIVYEYDMNLNLTDSTSVRNMNASSFCRIKDGFIFLNRRETGNRGKYLVTNKTLTKGVSFVKAEGRGPYKRYDTRLIFTSEVFIRRPFGNVLCFESENNDGFMYDGEKLRKVFHIGTDIADPDVAPLNNLRVIYASNGNILFNYYNDDGTDGMAFFDKNNNLVAQGPSYDAIQEGLFKYKYRQVGKKLVRIHMVVPERRGTYPYKASQAQFDFYRLK
jgi:hypothetical protein